MKYKSFFSAVLALVCSQSVSSVLLAQGEFFWGTNIEGSEWNAGISWGLASGVGPVAGDTAVFQDNVTALPSIPKPSLLNVKLGTGAFARDVRFSTANAETSFRIGQLGDTLTLSGGTSSSVSRLGNANTEFLANVVLDGTGRNLAISNTSSVGQMSFTSLNIGTSNTLVVSGDRRTNITTLSGAGASTATFSGDGTSTITTISGITTLNVEGGTNRIFSSVSGANNVNLSGGSSTIALQTATNVNITGGSHTVTVANGSSVSLGSAGTVSGGLTLGAGSSLSGTGTITGDVVIGNGAVHTPGNSPGLQTIAGNLTYQGGSEFVWDLNGNTTDLSAFDRIELTGTNAELMVEGSMNTRLVFTGTNFNNDFWKENRSWTVFSGVSNSVNVGNMNIVGTLPSASVGTFSWVQSGSNLNLAFSAVPEPGTFALLGLAAGIFGVVKRRQLKSMLSKPTA